MTTPEAGREDTVMNANENGNEVAEAAAPQAEKPKKSGKAKRSKAEIGASLSLGELADRYLKHLEETGKSAGTLFSYAIELKTAQRELGADTLISSLTPGQVGGYFASAAVMK